MNTSFQGSSEKGTNVWITPKKYIDALGPFDLDPCANVIMPWATANTMLTVVEDGLSISWEGYGRVFENPPYDRKGIHDWLFKMQQHTNGISLTYASTDVDWFDFIWNADAALFVKGCIPFLNEKGELPLNKKGENSGPGQGSVFAAWGRENVLKLRDANIAGIIPGRLKLNENYKLV